jgi:hypothetical protein
MIMAVPWLVATGIYNPQVMHHGRCMAKPGTFDALLLHGTGGTSSSFVPQEKVGPGEAAPALTTGRPLTSNNGVQ